MFNTSEVCQYSVYSSQGTEANTEVRVIFSTNIGYIIRRRMDNSRAAIIPLYFAR